MKKSALYRGIVIVAVAAMVFYAAKGYKSTEKESLAFVTEAIDTLAESWSSDDFRNMADPGLVKSMNGKEGGGVENLFAVYRTLGGLKGPADCELIHSGTLMKGTDNYDVATYHCKAEYEAGPAKIFITVRKDKAKAAWEIYYLKIESDSFGQPGETYGN